MKRRLLALLCALALTISASIPVSAACPLQQLLGTKSAGQTALTCQDSENCNFYSYLYALLQSRFQAGSSTSSPSGGNTVREQDAAETGAAPSLEQDSQKTQAQPADPSDQAQAILKLVNQYRAQYGLSALTLDTTLCTVAQVKAQDLHDKQYFSHQSPTYGSPYDLMADYGVSYRSAGENIAMGYSSAQAVMTAWMNSSSHRTNILNSSYTALGVGYVADGGYFVQEFIG